MCTHMTSRVFRVFCERFVSFTVLGVPVQISNGVPVFSDRGVRGGGELLLLVCLSGCLQF